MCVCVLVVSSIVFIYTIIVKYILPSVKIYLMRVQTPFWLLPNTFLIALKSLLEGCRPRSDWFFILYTLLARMKSYKSFKGFFNVIYLHKLYKWYNTNTFVLLMYTNCISMPTLGLYNVYLKFKQVQLLTIHAIYEAYCLVYCLLVAVYNSEHFGYIFCISFTLYSNCIYLCILYSTTNISCTVLLVYC